MWVAWNNSLTLCLSKFSSPWGSQVVLLHIYVSGMRDVSCLDMVLLCYSLCALWHGLCVMSLEQQRDMEEKNHRIPTCQEA